MILTAAVARSDAATARMRSVCLVGSTCFLEVRRARARACVGLGADPLTRSGRRALDVVEALRLAPQATTWPSTSSPARR